MSENLPAVPKPQIMAGGQVAALIPQSLDEAFRVSQAIAISGLAPRGIDKAEQIMVAIMAGAELGLAPFQSLQSFAVVNGRPTLWGDGLLAVVRGRGVKVREWLEGEGDGLVAHCECTRPDNGEQIHRAFSVADAMKAGLWGKQGPWQQYPKRMLQMRARSLSLRDGCADMLRGIQVREEVEDYAPIRNVTAEPVGLAARLTAGKSSATEGFTATREAQGTPHNPDTGEVIDADFVEGEAALTGEEREMAEALAEDRAKLEAQGQDPGPTADDFPGDRPSTAAPQTQGPTLADRAMAYETRLRDAPNEDKLRAYKAAAKALIADLDDKDPERLVELNKLYDERALALEDERRAGGE
jgi:hypothetical protein